MEIWGIGEIMGFIPLFPQYPFSSLVAPPFVPQNLAVPDRTKFRPAPEIPEL